MARSRMGPREPVERPADLLPSIPFPPMEAELVRDLPDGDGWQYEPKWDGFRGLLENGTGELRLWSRNARPLLRYFPELRRARQAPAAAVGARRRDRHRARRRPRLRRHADASPSRREPREQALGRDTRALHRVRHPRLEGHRGLAGAAAEAAGAPRAEREAVRALPRDARIARRRSTGWSASRRSASTASSRSAATSRISRARATAS